VLVRVAGRAGLGPPGVQASKENPLNYSEWHGGKKKGRGGAEKDMRDYDKRGNLAASHVDKERTPPGTDSGIPREIAAVGSKSPAGKPHKVTK